MTQLLVVGFSKTIRGKGLTKNKPTCENAVANHYEIKLHFQTSSFSLHFSQLAWKNIHFSSLFTARDISR